VTINRAGSCRRRRGLALLNDALFESGHGVLHELDRAVSQPLVIDSALKKHSHIGEVDRRLQLKLLATVAVRQPGWIMRGLLAQRSPPRPGGGVRHLRPSSPPGSWKLLPVDVLSMPHIPGTMAPCARSYC
jgi:hypothetical protein